MKISYEVYTTLVVKINHKIYITLVIKSSLIQNSSKSQLTLIIVKFNEDIPLKFKAVKFIA